MIFARTTRIAPSLRNGSAASTTRCHRPSSPELGGNYIWLAESPDLIHWGRHRCLAHSREGTGRRTRWSRSGPHPDSGRLAGDLSRRHQRKSLLPGGCCLTSTSPAGAGSLRDAHHGAVDSVRVGGLLRTGDFHEWPCGRRDRITMYYGAADSVICAAHLSVSSILATLVPSQGAKA